MNDNDKRIWKNKIGKALKVGSKVADFAATFQGNKSVTGATAFLLKSFDAVQSEWDTESFRGWASLSVPLADPLFRLLRERGAATPILTGSGGGDRTHYQCVTYGVRTGWVDHGTWCDGPWVENIHDVEKAQAALARFAWEAVNMHATFSLHARKIYFSEDILSESLPSKRAEEIIERTRAFTERGLSRAVLLHGEPGVGKSYILREVGKAFGSMTLRLSPEVVEDYDVSAIIEFMAPRVVLIDDFERVQRPERVLKNFEALRATTRLIMLTVNDLTRLDRAILRPGRIDDVIEISYVDDDVRNRLIGDVDDDIREKLEGLPIAYVAHFNKTREVLGARAALEEVSSLRERMEQISKMARKSPPEYPKEMME